MKKPAQTSAFKAYRQELVTQYASGEAREHAYRPALKDYIESFSEKLRATNEPGKRAKGKKGDNQNKPDFIVANGQAPIGFIETKDIGEDLDDVGKTDQIARYCEAYPNLILTDYLEFRRYVRGELRGKPVRIAKATKGGITFDQTGEKNLEEFFQDFLLEDVASVTSPQELARRLAQLTRQVRKLVKDELGVEEESVHLRKLMVAFQKTLMADLNVEKFADMFAQTLAYGFFASRVHYDGKGEFSRRTASSILPKTNPFLRRLFAEFANESLSDSLVSAVDEIVDLLRKTDIRAVLEHFGEQGREDPVVHFYESFLLAYDPKLKKAMGVFYTPDAVVSYMVRSLDEILQTHFGRKKGLADDKTLILDPALGTGSFLHKVVNVIHDRVPAGSWDSYVSERLLDRIFGFEILMAPYAVAHLNLGMQLQHHGYKFARDQRLGVYLTNTLEETAKRSEVLFSDWIAEEAAAAAAVKREKAIMVVMGNPPYSKESQNDGDWIRDLMRGFDTLSNKKCANYFECEGKPLGERNPKWLNDDYVKFLRFAHWRIEQTGHGVLAFITNHGYLDNSTFRGMREALVKDFDEIYVLDLHGSVKRKERAPDGSPDENVFDIQTGVSICFMVRKEGQSNRAGAKVYRTDLYGSREKKYEWLNSNSFSKTKFEEIEPVSPQYLFTKQNHRLRKEFDSGVPVNQVFPVNSAGVVTARDALTVRNTPDEVWQVVRDFSSSSESEARDKYALGPDARDWRVKWAQQDLKSTGLSKTKITPILYRPFDVRFTYFTGKSRGFICMTRNEVMQHMAGGKNVGLAFTRPMSPTYPFSVTITDGLMDQCAVGNKSAGAGISYLAPLFLDGGERANLSDDCQTRIKALGVTPEEFFYYVYASFHSSQYIERYSELLRSNFPTVQITSDKALLKRLSGLGRDLANLHLLKDDRLEGGSTVFAVKGTNVVDGARFDAKQRRVYINATQYFDKVPPECWNYSIGGYQVLEKWLKDRKGRKLVHDELSHFEKTVELILRTKDVVVKIDRVISDCGGWPLADQAKETRRKAA